MASSTSQMIEFLKLVGRLKHLRRTGWLEHDVKDPETVSGHMYRMSILSFLINDSDSSLNQTKCIKLSLAHDLAESIVGDLTPHSGVDPMEKRRREEEAMKELSQMAGPAGNELYSLFMEYEEQETPEAKFIKDLDRFDMVLQAFEYEKLERKPHNLEIFFQSTRNKFRHPLIKSLVEEVYKQRLQYETSQTDTAHGDVD